MQSNCEAAKSSHQSPHYEVGGEKSVQQKFALLNPQRKARWAGSVFERSHPLAELHRGSTDEASIRDGYMCCASTASVYWAKIRLMANIPAHTVWVFL